ncbi:MAG: hypothetical protein U1E17_04375 [Geminicoccaceae bacterium]
MTVWLGQDRFDYNFQLDYRQVWDWEVAGIRAIMSTADCRISLEYKPDEPRAHSLLRDAATPTARHRGGRCRRRHARLRPCALCRRAAAFAAHLVHRRSRLLGVHLNDAYAKRDDGLMLAPCIRAPRWSLLCQIRRDGYDGVLYFDTFPDASGGGLLIRWPSAPPTSRLRAARRRDRRARRRRQSPERCPEPPGRGRQPADRPASS